METPSRCTISKLNWSHPPGLCANKDCPKLVLGCWCWGLSTTSSCRKVLMIMTTMMILTMTKITIMMFFQGGQHFDGSPLVDSQCFGRRGRHRSLEPSSLGGLHRSPLSSSSSLSSSLPVTEIESILKLIVPQQTTWLWPSSWLLLERRLPYFCFCYCCWWQWQWRLSGEQARGSPMHIIAMGGWKRLP